MARCSRLLIIVVAIVVDVVLGWQKQLASPRIRLLIIVVVIIVKHGRSRDLPVRLVEGEASLRKSLLLLRHLAVGVHQHDSVTVGPEREGCLVTSDALVSKVLEDLLQSRLCYTVFLNSQVSLVVLELSKDPSDCLLILGDA